MDERIIRMKLEQLRARAVQQRRPIEGWRARLAEYLAPNEYRYLDDWASLPPGDSLWPAGQTLFLRGQAEVSEALFSDDLYLEFEFTALEGLLSVDGRPYAGLDANHARVVLPRAGSLALDAEFICQPGSLSRAELRREPARLRAISLVWVDRAVEGAYYDLRLAWEAGTHAPDERRRALLRAALEEALLLVDLTASDEIFREQVDRARRTLAARVGAIAPDPEGGRVFLAGHTHIDTAWLWPLRETVRKCARTFATACRLMERYPQFTFSCSQAQLYAYTQRHYPTLYAEIKHWVRTGRWECTGAMWVEPDCNVTSGESLIRQILYGLRFFRAEFGARPRTCWLPDVFGYPANLPQILKGCGIEQFMTCKLHWQARNPFPMHLFWWEGIDGTRLLAHIPRLKRYYNGWPDAEQLSFAWQNYLQKSAYAEVLLPFGFGDGGGGVTEEMLECAARIANYPGLPATRQGPEESYFADVRAAAPDLPRWVGELYLETHRGTYTTQSQTKRANRTNELLLREAEIVGLWANDAGAALDLGELKAAWENLLLLQFHDILPGSSIGQVYAEAAEDHARIAATARRVRAAALEALAEGAARPGEIVALNTLSWERSDVATITIPALSGPLEMVAEDGSATPAQVVAQRGGEAEMLFAPPGVPSLGYATFRVRPAVARAETGLYASEHRLENRYFLLELDQDGAIARLLDKRCGREVVTPGQSANVLHLYQDGPEREAAWNIHATYEQREYAWEPGSTLEVVERGPVRASVRVVRRYRESRIEQDVVLYAHLPRIDFVTRADWQARQVMLKAAFPLAVRSPRATYEVQFGAVERPTHRNTAWDEEKFEVYAQRWADLSEAGYGVSLLNDSRYGHDAHDNVLRLTLLRGAEWPDPDADRGRHEFTYALMPHLGDWVAAETVRRAYELNVPLVCYRVGEGGLGRGPRRRSFFEVSGPAILETIKPAEEGTGWVLRLYEPHGSRGPVCVRAPRAIARVVRCNLVEEPERELAADGNGVEITINPFEIVTLRMELA